MEQAPPFLEHPPRYVPLPHHLPPPNLSEDLNFYPRLLPPSRPLSPPPPSSHNDHQLLFPFSNHPSSIEDHLRIPPHHQHQHHLLLPPPPQRQPPPRVFDPNLDNSFSMSRSDSSWTDPPRVPPRNLIQLDHPTRHVLDSRLRFRDGFIDDVGYKPDHGGEEFLRDSTHVVDRYDVYDSHSPGSSWNFGFVNSHFSRPNIKSREYGSTVESHQSFRGFTMDNDRIWSNGSDENRRWVGHAWPPARSSSDACPVDGENKAFDNSNVLQAGFSRRVPHVYDYGKFRASREGNEEFHQSRRKEIERTSALHRIQVRKSAKRNRNGKQKFSRLCSIDSGPSTSGSRGPVAHTDIRVQPDREGSPVELDVSFKSNALVAKAIVASPSCRVISNKKLFRPELDHSNSTRNKSNSSADGFDRPTVSDKKSNHSGGSIKDLGGRDASDTFSQPSSHHTVELPRRNTMKEPVSDKFIDTVGSVGTSLLRLKKKKDNSYALRSPMMEKNVDLIKQDISISGPPAASQVGENSMHAREKSAPPGMVLLHNVDMQPSPREVTAFLDHIIENYTTGYIVSDKDGTEIDSGGYHVQNSKTTNSSTCPFGSSNSLKINVDEGYEIADASITMPTISFYAKGPAELQNGSAFTGSSQVDDFGHKIEPPIFLQNDFLKGQLEANKIYSPEEIKSDGVKVNLLTTVHNGSSSDNGLIRGQLKITVSDTDAVDTDSKFNEATVLAESVDVEGFPRAVPLVESKAIVGFLSNAEETSIQEDASDRYSSNDSATTTSGSDNGSKNYQSKSSFSGVGYLDDTGKESEDSATVLLDNVAFEGAPKATMLVRGDPHAGFEKGCTSNKRKDTSHNLPSPSSGDMSENPVGTTLSFPATELNFAEEYVQGAQSFSAGSQCFTDKDRIEFGYSPIKGSVGNDVSGKGSIRTSQNATSPKYMKKRKISAPFFPLPMLSETQEGSNNAGTFTSSAELPSLRDMVCSIHQEGSSGLPSSSESCPLLLEDFKAGISFEGVGFLEEGLRNNVSHLEQNENGELVMTIENVFGKEKVGRGPRGKSVEEPGVLQIDIIQQRNLVEIQTLDRDRGLPLKDVECEADLFVKNGLPPVLYPLSLYGQDDGVSPFDLHDTAIESAPDKLFEMDAEGTPSTATASKIVNTEIKIGQEPNDKVYMHERKQDERLVLEDLFSSNLLKTSPQNTTTNNKPGRAVGSVSSINTKVGPQDARKTIHGLNSVTSEITKRKNQLASVVPSISPGHLSKKTAPSSHRTKPRTWHRSTNPSASSHLGKSSYSNPFPPQRQQATNIGKDQTAAYIRKGNSLVRKPSPSATSTVSHGLISSVYRLYPPTVNEIKEKTGLVATLERPKTPPLPCSTKLSNCMTSSPLADPPPNGCSETNSDSVAQNINEDVLKVSHDAPNSTGTSEYQNGQVNNSVGQIVQDDRNSVSRELKKIVYVKRKSNQLVAASGSRDVSHQNLDKNENPSSNGYYKRRKNQIIRKSFKITQKVGLPSDLLIVEEKNCLPVIGSSSSGRRSGKGLGKTYKPSKSSLVWTLCGTESLKKENRLIHQVCPHLFPWKRATYRRSLMHISASVPSNTSLSTISQKLLLSRKRETIYTRSTQGFSLRKSKVLSIGGASLKWSKSIERKLKKANEEATLAVVAVDKKKREQNVAGTVTAGEKNRNCSSRKLVHSVELCPGERVFRVGSVRYKMDLTRRTLQRISDEESTNSAALQPGAKKSAVPKRLLIGTNEYVRIGNGNQLIRDPRKRTRILASEKVRWSLHNARLRLARKRKYCQFFTRFGKCNKDDGKCPYIHDSSKIVVCTKFLKGSCSDINCKLTHKAIPERMQDCSYFLQGLCTNENCAYRHVNVNPNASICEGFLRGYCADGNECQKKHSYVCPSFEATGTCTQGSKCKLHHPKKRNKGRKIDTSKEQKNTRGRYFGSKHIDILDSRTAVSGRHSAKDSDDIFYPEGRFADYIDLGLLDEEAAETNELVGKETTTASSYDGPMEMHEDKEELIKPVNLMSRSMK